MASDPKDSSALLPPEQWTSEYLLNPAIFVQALQFNPTQALTIMAQASVEFQQERQQFLASQNSPPPDRQDILAKTVDLLAQLQLKQITRENNPRLSASPLTPFDGTPDSLRPFLSQLTNRLQTYAAQFPDEQAKVRYAYDHLSSAAANKMRSQFRHLEDPSVAPEITTISQFFNALRQQFTDPALKDTANLNLATLMQKGQPFHDFLTDFEDLMIDSSFGSLDKPIWKEMLEQRLSIELRQIILASTAVPSSYPDFVSFLRTKDAGVQALKTLRSPMTTSASSRPGANPPSRPPMLPSPAARSTPPHNPSIPVSQGGTAMDLDQVSQLKGPDGRLTTEAKNARRALNRCLRCNKSGHFASLCPLGNLQLRTADTTVMTEQPYQPQSQLKDRLW